jgi:hypothetical protein
VCLLPQKYPSAREKELILGSWSYYQFILAQGNKPAVEKFHLLTLTKAFARLWALLSSSILQ